MTADALTLDRPAEAAPDWRKFTKQFLAKPPVPPARRHVVTKALDGEGNHIGWLIRQGSDRGPVVHQFPRGDQGLAAATLTRAILQENPKPGFIELDELRLLKFLGPDGARQWTCCPLTTDHLGLAGCLAKEWIYLTPYGAKYNVRNYRLTDEGSKVAERFFPPRRY